VSQGRHFMRCIYEILLKLISDLLRYFLCQLEYNDLTKKKYNEMIGQKHYEHNEMIHGELVCDEVGI
jgi:hypothetical protein